MANCRECIYFGKDEDFKDMYVCKKNCSLFTKKELDSGWMGHRCRLWDSFIPMTATDEEIKSAQEWQNMKYGEQPDYEEYFNIH